MSAEYNTRPFHKREKIPVEIFPDASDASRQVAAEIAGLIRQKAKENIPCVLGLATGSTPTGVYQELIRLHQEEGLTFQNVFTFNLDEYFPMQPEELQSYVRFMKEHLFDHIDLPADHIHIPDGTIEKEGIQAYCRSYEEKIESLGGLDLQLLGIGRTGHIGFNEPGSGADSRTRLITLDHITRVDAASDFFGEENVPLKALTMGVGTILEARRIVLMAWGEGKAPIIKDSVEGPVSDTVPATYLQNHPNALVVLDDASSAELTRIKTPWLLGPCQWQGPLIRKAVVWLSLKTQKPILKLTNRDYLDQGMSDLITEYDSAYYVNIRVFNQLQHTITGWPGGKPNADDSQRPERAIPQMKRVIIFSPHPDDDVISMGGTFSRLHEQGHEVHVAYQTSGNIAIFDDDVIRFVDFVHDFSESFHLPREETRKMFHSILQQLDQKKKGEIDPPEVRQIKTLIRRGEAKSACRHVGIPLEHVHFLDLPFYETGLVKKKELSEPDIEIIAALLRQIKPHQVFAAGDLSDPHGTHRVCLQAIFQALDRCENEAWIKDCWVWLYRGAWQEWDIHETDMAVPLSPDELLRKRRAIFKHQSQKDRPLFPGHDSREFWQRSEARNRNTARLYDQLGLAEYEAIEAFRRYSTDKRND